MTWGGLRGALPMVLVLSIPDSFPHKDFFITMTFGVVIISMLVHGLTISPLLKWLGIVKGREEQLDYEITKGRLQAANAALIEMEKMSNVYFSDKNIMNTLRKDYQSTIEGHSQKLDKFHLQKEEIYREELKWAKKHLLLVEKTEIIDSFHHGIIGQRTQEKLLAEIDSKLIQLESGEG